MAAPDPAAVVARLALALGLAAAAGCGSVGGPKARPVEPEAPPAAAEEAPADTAAAAEATPPEGEAATAEAADAAPVERRDVIVIERPGAEPAEPTGLYEASVRARRERAEQGGRAGLVITDANLREHAARGEITDSSDPAESEPEAAAAEAAADGEGEGEPEAAAAGAPEPAPGSEADWRRRVRDARLRWRDAVERIGELEEEAAKLRWDFYATDDPFYRDSQIKPAWDRALRHLEEARAAAEFGQRDLEALLEEGRRAGALPGWLREGIELEPAPEERGRGEPDEHRPSEPVVVDDEGEPDR